MPRGYRSIPEFIVYNEATYPNLTALFRHLGVVTKPSEMSFAVSLDDGRLEYSGTNLAGLFAQPGNLLRPRFWSMLADLRRFYRNAPRDAAALGLTTLDDYLAKNYGSALRDDPLSDGGRDLVTPPAKSESTRLRHLSGFATITGCSGLASDRCGALSMVVAEPTSPSSHNLSPIGSLPKAWRSDGSPTRGRGRDHR